ncbi:MAG: hypothetical protein CVT92_10690 [Bacteroidetes bacterium HGW-Bacteroidetes-1]|jgi:ligand-binding sensor domain-containing protein|nr:MAG: hypothetical protein CVT92_10690 [Bacteroidetes bacterium HGW-Bacteroidetes-1]
MFKNIQQNISLLLKPIQWISFVLLFLAFSPTIIAQSSLYFDRFLSENTRIERGLSQNSIYTIFQDEEGFMWFGTWDGLNRFDGYNFVTYNKEQGLSNETIRAVFQHENVLWVGTEMGLNAINLEDGKISSFFSIEGDSASLSDNWINHITRDHDSKLWISTAKGLTELDSKTMQFRQVFSRDYGNPIRSNKFNMLVQDEKNNYWIATSHGLVFFEIRTQIVTRFFNIPGDSTSLPDNQVNCLLFDPDGTLWIGTKNGVAHYDTIKKIFHSPPIFKDQSINLQETDVLSMMFEKDSSLWIGTNGQGLFRYKIQKQELVKFSNIPNHPSSLSDNRVFNIYRDQNGMIWFGTFNGLNKLNHNAPKFRTYRSNPDIPNSLSNNSVWCFEEDLQGRIWIGTEDGLSVLDQSTNNYFFLKNDPGNPNSLSGNQIRTIRKDAENRFWIGTRYTGLNSYNSKTKQFTRYRHNLRDQTSIPDDFVLSLAVDSNFIWVGTDKGLGKLNPETGLFTNYYHKESNPASLPDNRIYDLFIDSQQTLWICTSDGLARYNERTDDFKVYKIETDKQLVTPISSNKFFSIRQDRNGILWMGTRGGGLVRFDAQKEVFKVFTDQDGLPNNITYLAIEDNQGDLWITSNWGLTRFSPDRMMFTNYEVTDGLQSNEFNFNAGMITSKGELLFGGMNGFNAFYPNEIELNTKPPVIQITAFKLFNVLKNRRIKNNDTLLLRYDDNVFSFEFAALDYTNPDKIKYRYTLENYNSGWIERNADQRFAEYAKVSPGTYRFRVIASNSDGFWNEEGVSVNITIRPPWYGTWLFRSFLMLLTIFLVYLVIFLRMRAIRKEHEVEKKYLEFEKQMFGLEQKALQLQMNPHFLFNSLNSIQSFIVNNDIDNAIHYLSKFSMLMRRTLANSRESYVSLRDEIQALRLYIDLEKLRFNEKFDYILEIDPDIDESFIEIPPMILQPYVENAIIHGLMHKAETGHLLIQLNMEDENIMVVIQDNGVGREKANEIRRESGIERKSRGMLITRERLEMLNQYTKDTYTVNVIDLTDENGNPSGTRVEIMIHANVS